MSYKLSHLFAILLFTILHQNSYSQNLPLAGRVVSASDQQPLPGVTVRLLGTSNARVTDESGAFSFDNLSAGQYTLTFSYLGYESSRLTITLPSSNSGNL